MTSREILVTILSGYCLTAYWTRNLYAFRIYERYKYCVIEINLHIVHIQKSITLHNWKNKSTINKMLSDGIVSIQNGGGYTKRGLLTHIVVYVFVYHEYQLPPLN